MTEQKILYTVHCTLYLSDAVDAHPGRRLRVEDLLHHLDLAVVVSCAQCTQLRKTSFLCSFRHLQDSIG